MFRQVSAGILLVVAAAAGESENIGSVSICCLLAVFTTTTITYLSIHNQLTPKNAAEETRTFPSPRPKYSWSVWWWYELCCNRVQWCNSIITRLHMM